MSATEISPARRYMVLATMCLSLVLVVAGVSMLSNALPDIAQGLDPAIALDDFQVLDVDPFHGREPLAASLAAALALDQAGFPFSAFQDSGRLTQAIRALHGRAPF